MNVNERIARALGWEPCIRAGNRGHWHRERKGDDYDVCWSSDCTPILPDYAHSLDACLPVLADLREKGWQVSLWSSRSAWHVAMLNPKFPKLNPNAEADDLAAALAECIAEALEASDKGGRS